MIVKYEGNDSKGENNQRNFYICREDTLKIWGKKNKNKKQLKLCDSEAPNNLGADKARAKKPNLFHSPQSSLQSGAQFKITYSSRALSSKINYVGADDRSPAPPQVYPSPAETAIAPSPVSYTDLQHQAHSQGRTDATPHTGRSSRTSLDMQGSILRNNFYLFSFT